MSRKRKNTSSPECEYSPEIQHVNVEETTNFETEIFDDTDTDSVDERPQVDTHTGQSGAFPGLKSDDDEIFYGPAADGLDYLRMVRSEAKGIPSLLRVSVENSDLDQGTTEHNVEGGYWDEDGTYTAISRTPPGISRDSIPKAQLEYYKSLLVQFQLVRATMKCVPPLTAIEKLTSSQPISFPSENRKAKSTWLHCLKTRTPSPTQIACMDAPSVFELVRLITLKMRNLFEDYDIEGAQRVASWIWAVLGKCPDRGELSSDEISQLRDLAKKAIVVRDWLLKKIKPLTEANANTNGQEDNEDYSEGSGGEDIGIDIVAARQQIARDTANATSEHDEEVQYAKQEKLLALDTTITIVGEVYGQRDLLELRLPWE